jgi:hypothetical protein
MRGRIHGVAQATTVLRRLTMEYTHSMRGMSSDDLRNKRKKRELGETFTLTHVVQMRNENVWGYIRAFASMYKLLRRESL